SFQHGRAGPPDRGVCHHPDRLVDHDDVGVLVHDLHARNGFCPWHRSGGRRRKGHFEPNTRLDPIGLARGDTVDQGSTVDDDLRRASARQPEQAGDGGVEPLTLQPVGHGQASGVAHRPLPSPGLSSTSMVAFSSEAKLPSRLIPLKVSTTTKHAPTTTHESAMLNTGQCGSRMKSTTAPWKGPGSRK